MRRHGEKPGISKFSAAGEPAKTPGAAESQGDGAKNEPASGQPKDKEKTKTPSTRSKAGHPARSPWSPLIAISTTSPCSRPSIWGPAGSSTSKRPSTCAPRSRTRSTKRPRRWPGSGAKRSREFYHKFGEKISVYPQFSQYTAKGDPRVHRVVHLTYRVGHKDLSYPRPLVDLTTREVTTPPRGDPEPRRQ